MKKKTPINEVYSFNSFSSPHDFIARVKEEAIKSNLKFEQTENGFDLQIGSNHGGRIVYRANLSADENGGSFISGEIITIPWVSSSKKKNIFQKILSFLRLIVVLPFVLIVMVFIGIYALFLRLFGGKSTEPTDEEKLCDFMTNKMSCEQK